MTAYAIARQVGCDVKTAAKYAEQPERQLDRRSAGRTAITNWARKITAAGGSLRDVQSLAGHASLADTQRYIDQSPEADVAALSTEPGREAKYEFAQ